MTFPTGALSDAISSALWTFRATLGMIEQRDGQLAHRRDGAKVRWRDISYRYLEIKLSFNQKYKLNDFQRSETNFSKIVITPYRVGDGMLAEQSLHYVDNSLFYRAGIPHDN